MRLAILLLCALDRTDIERGMGPGRLGQVFDDARDAVIAFDEQDVARRDDTAQIFRIARRERLIARYLLLKVTGNHLADHIERDAHDALPPGGLCGCIFLLLSWSIGVAIWFMHDGHQS